MLKRILVISTMVALTGCATHQQANTAVGAGVGAVVGHAIGGRGGAAVGAVVGSAIGSNQPVQTHPTPVYIERQVIIPGRKAQCQAYRIRLDNCNSIISPVTRHYCRRDAENHYENCLYRH